jgi:cytochrome c-type biogenesis protein CcmH/NrfG
MTIRPKTKRRVLILLTGATLFCGGAGWLYSYRIAIAERRLQADKQIGLDAFRAGNYQLALDKLTEYINHEEKRAPGELDPQALLAFANARAKVPTKNEDYIVTAVTTLRRYCILVPNDQAAKDQLLEMEAPYSTYTADAVSRANDILRDNPNDLVALKALAEIYFREQKYTQAAPYVTSYIALVPTDLELQRVNYLIMQSTSRPAAEMHQHADALLAKYPNDPRFKIVKAWAYYYGRNPLATPEQNLQDASHYRALLLQAATADPPSVQFAKTAIVLLDGISEYAASGDLLTRASAKFSDPQLTLQAVARLWENRHYADVVARLKDLDPTSATTSSNLIAFKAMSLYEVGQNKDADALVNQLEARGNDDHLSYAWATALRAQYTLPPEDLKTRLAHYQDARAASPENGYIAFLLGDAYAQMGESDLALQAFRESCQTMPSWAEPHVRLAQLLVHTGRGGSDEAARAAENARLAGTSSTGNTDLQAAIASIRVRFARLSPSVDSDLAKELLDEVKQIQKQIPGEPQTLPIYVALEAQLGHRDVAVDAIDQACQNPGNGGEDLLLDLAAASKTTKLGLEQNIYKAIEAKYGLTPRLAYIRAMDALGAGRADEGLQILLDAQKNSKNAGEAQTWQRAICQYREAAHDPQAPGAWEALGNAYPADVMIQSTILTSANSAWSKRDFIAQTINRLKTLTGDSAVGWKIAQARWLLSGNGGDADVSSAISLLASVTTDNPEEYLPHVLLATAYDRLNNTSAALEEWRKAAESEPQSPQAQYAYLQALHKAGRKEDEQVVFDRLAGLSNLPPDLALASATILAADGDMQRAENMLVAYPNPNNRVLHDATLAKVYRVENRPSDAAAIYFNLQNLPNLDAGTIREAADFFAAQNQIPEARKFLDRLSQLQLPGGQQELIQAAFEEEHGTPQAAAKYYDAAVQAAGNDPQPSIRRIGFLIRRHDWNKSRAALSEAAAHFPNNAAIGNLGTVEGQLASYVHIDELGPLVEAVTNDPMNPAAVETVALATDPSATVSQVRALLDKYPDFEPLYELTSRRLMAAGNAGDAVEIARKAMGRFPRSVDAARTTAEANAAAGNWSDAMIAGREWRQRVTENPQAADEFIAMADLAVAQPLDAIDHLAPYIDAAKQHPDNNQSLIAMYAQALLRCQRQADAQALLQPLAENSPQWRLVWLNLAPVGFTDAASAQKWIDQIKPHLAADLLEQSALAEVYVSCAEHQNAPEDFSLAVSALKPYLADPGMTARQWLTYAGAAGGSGDQAGAQQAYRQVLKLDSTSAVAENNLADLLRQSSDPQTLKEAETLASQAATTHPGDPQLFNYYDTLGRVLLKEGRAADAIAAFEKGNALNPKSLDILIGLASTCASNDRIDEAVRCLAQVDSILPPGSHLSPELEAELAAARQAVRKNDSRGSISGTNFSANGN